MGNNGKGSTVELIGASFLILQLKLTRFISKPSREIRDKRMLRGMKKGNQIL